MNSIIERIGSRLEHHMAHRPATFVPGQITPVRKRLHVVHMRSWGTDRNGNVTWFDDWADNILHDEGEQLILSAVFATGWTNNGTWGATPSTMYLGLDNRTTLAESDTLATVAANGEPTTGGYARKSLTTSGTGAAGQAFVMAQPAAYYIATSSTQTWTASGANYGTVKNRFLCTHLTATTSTTGQRLIASLALSTARTVNDGDSLSSNIAIGLSE